MSSWAPCGRCGEAIMTGDGTTSLLVAHPRTGRKMWVHAHCPRTVADGLSRLAWIRAKAEARRA